MFVGCVGWVMDDNDNSVIDKVNEFPTREEAQDWVSYMLANNNKGYDIGTVEEK